MPMMMRRRGVGLLGVAAVAGVAAHAGSKSAQGQANEQAQNQQIADLQAQQNAAAQQQYAPPPPQQYAPPPPPPPAPGGMTDEKIAQLQQLGALKAQGILTEEEFNAKKRRSWPVSRVSQPQGDRVEAGVSTVGHWVCNCIRPARSLYRPGRALFTNGIHAQV